MKVNGWKQVAAHFGRDRTTVMRWEAEKNLPVHRIPGKGRGSVYAYTEELDQWLKNVGADIADDAAATQGAAPDIARPGWGERVVRVLRRRRVLIAVLVVVFAASGIGLVMAQRTDPQRDLPSDPATARLYLEARSEWAERNARSIEVAIPKLRRVIEREPGFAGGHVALAEAYLLSREFGSMPDLEAFAEAERAVIAALRIQPDDAAALRAKGFIDYWWNHDAAAAGDSFRQSLAHDDEAVLTHYWFGNALVDNGDFDAGLAELNKALLQNPASPSLLVDIAWAQWSMGDDARALATLRGLEAKHPGLATVHELLVAVELDRGNLPAVVDQMEKFAKARGEKVLSGHAAALRAAQAKGVKAVADEIRKDALAGIDARDQIDLVWPAFVASSLGDRPLLMQLLRGAEARNEAWGSAGMRRRIAARWSGDREVIDLLDRRAQPSMSEK